MDPIDNISRTMEALRREMGRNLEKLRREGTISTQQQRPSSKPSIPLRQAAARAIAALNPSDSLFAEKAVAAFVESVLLNEFGTELLDDIEFRNLVARVSTTMLADPVLAADLSSVIRQLARE